MMQVRLATSEDAEQIAGVHVRSWQVAYRGLIPDETIERLDVAERTARWHTVLEGSVQDVFVVVVDGFIRGFCSLESSRDEGQSGGAVGKISSLYVDPAYWGRGLGHALCTAAVARAQQREFHRLALWVLEHNYGARRFYERQGFVRDGETEYTRGFGGGAEIPQLRYLKHLGGGRV